MFKLSTDTSCDVLKNELEEAGIAWIPLSFTIDGVTYYDDFTSDEQYKDFYAKIRAGAMPTTSQISAFAHEEYFEKLIEEGATEIVHLTLSSGLSATYSMACQAAKNVNEKHPDRKVFIVDSLGATQVHRMVLDEAMRLRDDGESAENAVEKLGDYASKLHVLFIVDSLAHLRRGGRISGAAAAVGSLLKIKPIITFDTKGALHVAHKPMGMRKALEYVSEHLSAEAGEIKKVYMAHGDAPELVEQMTELLRAKFPDCVVKSGWCGPVIGAHTGAGMLGVIVKCDTLRPYKG